jgi:hypothetical protein
MCERWLQLLTASLILAAAAFLLMKLVKLS